MNQVAILRDQKAALLKEAEALQAKEMDGSITEDELKRLDEMLADGGDLAQINAKIARAEKLADERRNAPLLDSEKPAAGQAARDKTEKPFASFGEQLQAIARAGMNKGDQAQRDARLVWQAAAGANEAVPSEGGFLVQPDFSTELLDLMHETGDLLALVRRVPLSVGNGIKLPMIDETSRADGSRFGGVEAFWAAEAATVNSTKPKFREMELNLKKLIGLGYATDELLADSTALEAVMRQAFTEELTFRTEDAVYNGDGAGKPLGFMNSGALISVAKQSGQAAATVVTQNVLDMWSRMPARSRKTAVWLVNQDVEPQLWGLTLGSGTAVLLLYTPPGVRGNDTPYGLLMGRPVIPVEYAATLGTAGDIVFFDPQQYVMIDKNGLQAASSMHVRFIYDEMTFRFIYRVDGQPAWRKALTPKNGSNTLSPYVALSARA